MSFVNHLENETNVAITENGAITKRTTKSCLLDLFAMGGALRTRQPDEIVDLFAKAFIEDKELALKMLFYLRDCRGGVGERRTFRVIIVWLANNYPDVVVNNIESIPFYGRYDDLLCLLDTPVSGNVIDLIATTIGKIVGSPQDKIPYDILSLVKWLPSENASSKETKRFAKIIMKVLGSKPKEYRKFLSKYRSILGIVERKMSKNEWKYIKYSAVPSRASLIYRKAFTRHDETGYLKYLADVKEGKAKINTKALFPYEIIKPYMDCYNPSDIDETLNVMWDNLPDYTGEGENALVVADVSGSMMGDPMAVSVSLAMYFAERNKNEAFKNTFITFSRKPSLQKIMGANLFEKVQYLMEAHWEQNTDLIAVFQLLLNTAVKYNVPANELPSKIYIISDMEFDACTNNSRTNYETISDMYKQFGYEIPKLVFWNVDSRNNQTPVTVNDNGTFLVSGLSPKIFEYSMKSKALCAYDLMLDTINSERYKRVCTSLTN